MPEINDVSKIIAAINPSYASNPGEVKEELKKKFWDAVDKAEPKPAHQNRLVYDSSSQTLEPIYFWILDFMNDMFSDVEKLVDNFTSSPGSGHFSELMGKATRMQEQAGKILGNVNTVVKSIINIIYDLKEFEIRINHYKQAKSKDKEKAGAGLLSLKQIWMDNVDIKRGRGSINQLAQQLNFVTLRDAFMAAKSEEDVEKMDLNDRVRRILKARVSEFFEWRERSEKELIKRYEIEKTYLKSQVNSLKLYTRWAKPYLKAATKLEQSENLSDRAGNVTAFNTILLELAIFGKNSVDVEQAIVDKDLPEAFKKRVKKFRKYYSCVLVDFFFRGIPQKAGQHYAFGGRTEVNFRSYALNEEEWKMLKQKIKESEMNDALRLVQGVTDESLEQLREDIDKYLEEEEEEEENKGDVNPFSALLGLNNKKEKKEEDEEIEKIKKDRYEEKMLRELAEKAAEDSCYTVYDIYKKAHGMASLP